MNDLMIFKNEEFGEIKTLEINNEPYFIGNEIATVLGYKNTRDALLKHVDSEDKISDVAIYDGSQNRNMVVINESGLYSLIMSSKLPNAKRFKRWVTSEVLPSIRKTGGYIAGEENMTEDELILKAMNVLNAKVENLKEKNRQLEIDNEKQNQLIGELKPKADYTDKILKSKGTIKVNVIANDYGFTATAFNKKLKELGIQYKEGKDWLLYRKYRGKGYTHTKTFSFYRNDGTPDTETNMEWTQKGRLFLYNKLKEHGILPMIEII